MTHYYIELLLWLLVAYFVGCFIGAILKKLLGTAPATEVEVATSHAATQVSEPATVEAASLLPAEPAPGHAPLAPRRPASVEMEASASTANTGLGEDTVLVPQAPPEKPTRARMPVGIAAPRAGGADPLQRISGVGPKNEQILHSLGFYHFDQIAQWTDDQVEWVDGYLRFNGRIKRENWVEQCRLLAAGDEAEFSRLYGTGGMEDATGVTRSGERTRH